MRRGEKRKSRYREDEACVHRHGSFSFTLENGIEDGADAAHGAWGSPQLKANDAVGGQVPNNR